MSMYENILSPWLRGIPIAEADPLYGISGFSNANYYLGVDGQGPGLVDGASYAALVRIDTATDAYEIIFSRGSTVSNSGWYLAPLTNQGTAQGEFACLGGSAKTSLFPTPTAGKTYLLSGKVASGTVTGYVQGVAQTPGAGGSFNASIAGDAVRIGRFITGLECAAQSITVLGCAAVSSALSDGNMLAWYAACVAAGRMVVAPAGGTTTHLWDAADAGPTWTDRVAGIVLTRQGSLSSSVVTPDWG